MYRPTYQEIVNQVQAAEDLQEEQFVQPSELLGYINEGQAVVETEIHTLYEDYFLTSVDFPMVANQSDYDLPDDIYGNKIRRLLYIQPNTNGYEIPRVRNLSQLPYLSTYVNPYSLMYMLVNSTLGGPKLRYFPPPNVDVPDVQLWYLRGVTRFTGAIDQRTDIPEFAHVVVQYAKWRCQLKAKNPQVSATLLVLESMKENMQATLQDRVPDENNKILLDTSFYSDFDTSMWGGGGF